MKQRARKRRLYGRFKIATIYVLPPFKDWSGYHDESGQPLTFASAPDVFDRLFDLGVAKKRQIVAPRGYGKSYLSRLF